MQNWIQTFTGKKFYPLEPKKEDINITDIAHALSNQCRFAGHCTQFYSIAQHSVLVSLMCPEQHMLRALLHDAAETYLVDIPSPLKVLPEFEPYRIAEKRLMDVICEVFDLDKDEPDIVKYVDKRMLATEARDLTLTEGRGWSSLVEPFEFHIRPWTPEYARAKFISRFYELYSLRKLT